MKIDFKKIGNYWSNQRIHLQIVLILDSAVLTSFNFEIKRYLVATSFHALFSSSSSSSSSTDKSKNASFVNRIATFSFQLEQIHKLREFNRPGLRSWRLGEITTSSSSSSSSSFCKRFSRKIVWKSIFFLNFKFNKKKKNGKNQQFPWKKSHFECVNCTLLGFIW